MPDKSDVIYTRVLPTLRELIRGYRAFYEGSTADIQKFGLSLEQFDIIAALGNNQRMNLLQLYENTLLAHPTIQETLDELQTQEVVAIERSAEYPVPIFRLTPVGEKLFQISFAVHMQYLTEKFGQLEDSELKFLQQVLKHVSHSFQQGRS
jgi:MarR family transcriptional regulator, 2-MHQ and catechol-resistance regulon repressor